MMNAADIKLSKGESPKSVDPKKIVYDCFGRPVAVWTGKTISR